MSARLSILIPSEGVTEIKDGITARWHRGRLRVDLRSDLVVAAGPASLSFYEQMLPAVYGDSIKLLKVPIAKFTVDRVKQALYWDAETGQRLYIFPYKNSAGKIEAFETWIE